MERKAIYNRQFSNVILPRRVAAGLVPGTVLARNEAGALVKYEAGNKFGPQAVLLSPIGQDGVAFVGFAGVYWLEGVKLEGLPSDTAGRLEARGIHLMGKRGEEPVFAAMPQGSPALVEEPKEKAAPATEGEPKEANADPQAPKSDNKKK